MATKHPNGIQLGIAEWGGMAVVLVAAGVLAGYALGRPSDSEKWRGPQLYCVSHEMSVTVTHEDHTHFLPSACRQWEVVER